MRNLTLGTVILSLVVFAYSDEAQAECGGSFDHEHSVFNGLLKQYVSKGSVNYTGWRSGGRAKLNEYLSGLEGVCRSDYQGWNRNQKLAYWINAYNAYTIKLVLDNFPTSSIMKIGGGGGKAFKQRFIPLESLRGSKLSLNDIENNIIRRELLDPRIHFVLVCAAKSCPRLRSEAYRAEALNRQMESETRAFIRRSSANRYDSASNTLQISHIFEWYAEDFQLRGSTVSSFIARYLDADAAAAVKSRNPRITYLEYDWSLNGR